jgi:hypothetical protein
MNRLTPSQFAEWQRRRDAHGDPEISTAQVSSATLGQLVRALSAAGYRIDLEISGKVPWRQEW